MKNKFEIKEPMILIDYLINILNKPRKKAKSLLTNKAIYINGKNITKYNYPLFPGNILEIKEYSNNKSDLDIIYEDKYIIVVNKKSGLLTISTENENEKTLYHQVSDYVKLKNKNARIFVIHRLDRDTSGVVMFAKDEKTKRLYQDNWDKLVSNRKYVAVLSGKPKNKQGRIIEYLVEKENMKVYAVSKNKGKIAITNYKIIKFNNKYTLVDIDLETGRKNQIRVAMQNMNTPIVGDKKYGSLEDPIKRLGLHAYKIVITNPLNNKKMEFTSPYPDSFNKIVK